MSDPFLITSPAVISFSGGRTSAYMLRRILDAHGGALPNDVLVCFANTGREMPATLDFVQDCGAAWNVRIAWLEFRHGYLNPHAKRRTRWAEVVSHNSASRNGEPFDLLLESKRIVPDSERRFCTEQLKVRTVIRYLRSLGWTHWTNVVGFRADEAVRIEKKAAADIAMDAPFVSTFPLADAGVQEFEILKAWRTGTFGFDLRLDADGDGGNCDGCFMFSAERLGRMFTKYPERMDWWPQKERQYGTKTMAPGRSYESVRQTALNQGVLNWRDGGSCETGCTA